MHMPYQVKLLSTPPQRQAAPRSCARINMRPSPRPRCPMPPRPAFVDAPDAMPLHRCSRPPVHLADDTPPKNDASNGATTREHRHRPID